MNSIWKKTLASVIVSTTLLTAVPASIVTVRADDGAFLQSTAEMPVQYRLTDVLMAEVKSVLSEKTGGGTRIGAVVKLINTGSSVTRVPDYEIRVKAADGTEYKLQSSGSNAKAIQPKEKVELTYMITLDRDENVLLSELSWVDVDEYVYPKIETAVVTVPVAATTWQGNDTVITNQDALKQWGEAFRLPMLTPELEFTPVSLIEEKTDKGPVSLITLVAENKGTVAEDVPSFSIDGKTDSKTYEGVLLEKKVELQPGEKKNLHVAITREQNAVPTHLLVVTRESYTQAGQQTPVQFSVGRLSIGLPDQGLQPIVDLLTPYKLGETMAFDPYSKLIDSQLKVSMVELSLSGNDADGYRTILAKLLLRNTSERPLALPALGMELTSLHGSSYIGSRQTTVNDVLMPNLGYIVDYSFTVPSSETGEFMLLKMMDNQTVAPYSVPVSGYKVAAQVPEERGSNVMKLYPYDVELRDWSLSYLTTFGQIGNATIFFNYKLKLNLEIHKLEDVLVDESSSKLKIELVDKLGRILGSESFSFTGVNRLISGEQTLTFSNIRTEQQEYPLTVKIYEAITTPTGEAKRLIKTLQQ